jgi:hypothetical protein
MVLTFRTPLPASSRLLSLDGTPIAGIGPCDPTAPNTRSQVVTYVKPAGIKEILLNNALTAGCQNGATEGVNLILR